MFIGELAALMLGNALLDRPVDLLLDMPTQTLPAPAAGRRECGSALLFEALTQLRLASSLLAIPLLSPSQFAVKGSIMLAI